MHSLLDHDKLLRVIDADLRVCRDAASKLHPADMKGREQNNFELGALIEYKQRAERAGDDQAELERIVQSLETNLLLSGYQRWRGQSETKSCPEHNKPMRFPTSLRLESGNVIERLYFCPVDGCTWRYLDGVGYKKATEF